MRYLGEVGFSSILCSDSLYKVGKTGLSYPLANVNFVLIKNELKLPYVLCNFWATFSLQEQIFFYKQALCTPGQSNRT